MAKKSRKKDGKLATIKREKLLHLLKQVFLGGIINECVLDIRKGVATVEAVDITNSLIVIVKGSVMSKDVKTSLGVGNLDLLIRFLNAIGEKKLYFKEKGTNLTVSKKDSSRKLNYLLTQPDLIPTRLSSDDDDPKGKINDMTIARTDLTEAVAKDILTYLGIADTKDVKLVYEDEQLTFVCGKEHEHQFEIVSEADVDYTGDEPDDFELMINGEHLANILSILAVNDMNPVSIHFGPDVPVVIEDKNAFWALSSTVDEEED